MAQVGAFVRERMLEELLTGEVLEVRVVDPTLAYLFIGQGEDVLEQQKTNHEAGLDPGPALVAVERRDLAVEPFPIEFSGKLHQLVPQVDDLIEPGPERSLASVVSCFFGRIIPSDATTESLFVPEGNPKNE